VTPSWLVSHPALSGVGSVGLPARSSLKTHHLTPTPQALGENLNPAQRIRVEGFDHMTTVGARQRPGVFVDGPKRLSAQARSSEIQSSRDARVEPIQIANGEKLAVP
jgi:hypothetical protein